MLYFVFCKSFAVDHGQLTAKAVGVLAVWVLGVHIVLVLLALLLARIARQSTKRAVAVLLVAPQKTEGLAVAIIKVIFAGSPDIGQLSLPAVMYHTLQMLVATLLIPVLRRQTEEPVEKARAPLGYSELSAEDDLPDTLKDDGGRIN